MARARLAATAARAGGDGLGEKRDLLRNAPVTRLLADAHERRELVVQRIDVLETRVHDLEAQVAQWVALRETFEDHLADPLRRDLGDTALPHRRLEIVDQPVGVLGTQRLRSRLFDRACELAPVELLPAAVALADLDSGGLAALERREPLLAAVADAAPADGRAVLSFARVDYAGVGIATGRTAHRHKIWDGLPPNLVVG